jgi:hypothetical protein
MSIIDTTSPILVGYEPAEDFAKAVHKTPRTVRRWEALGLPVVRVGNLKLIDVERARAWLAARQRGGIAPPRYRSRNRA